MGRLLVKCEKCGSFYPSGIIAELEDVKRRLKDPKVTATTTCPYCRHENVTASAKLVITPSIY